jgi:hypothetical protein
MSRAAFTRRLPWLAILVAVGCGPQFGTIEGTVTVDGKPANKGSVIFSSADNRSASGAIQPDGSYLVENVPVGEVRVSFLQMLGGPARPGPLQNVPGLDEAPSTPAAKPVPIPRKYLNVETSGLRYTVTGGTSEININLSSK